MKKASDNGTCNTLPQQIVDIAAQLPECERRFLAQLAELWAHRPKRLWRYVDYSGDPHIIE